MNKHDGDEGRGEGRLSEMSLFMERRRCSISDRGKRARSIFAKQTGIVSLVVNTQNIAEYFSYNEVILSPQTTPTIRYEVTARQSEFAQMEVSVMFEHQDVT